MIPILRRAGTRWATRGVATKPSAFGQPTHVSHPHLIQSAGDLTPGIPTSEYELRRRKLMNSLPDKSVVVAVAASVKYMSANIFYDFRQDSDFWYLTGFQEPNSAVILEKDSSPRGYKMTFLTLPKDLAKEKWEGPRTGFYAAKDLLQADETEDIANFSSHLKSISPTSSFVYVDLPSSKTKKKGTTGILDYLTKRSQNELEKQLGPLASQTTRPLAPAVGKLRMIKSEVEQAVMKAAGGISGRAHAKTMRFAQPGMSEGAIAAHFEYICKLQGAQRPAYVPVVASGPNSLILHYTFNNQIVEKGELVLIDAGCEYNGYASDITRTFPASGMFSGPQRDLYSAVLHAQKEMIKLCSESAGYTLQELHRKSCTVLKEELNQIGFNLGREGDLERILYPHHLSHHIGVDLHESTHTDRAEKLRQGMVVTIEPGIYVPPTANFPTHFHNIGIRIEDVVLIGEKHPTVLTVNAPKEIADVEAACQGTIGLEPY